jgi:hypothetical protein
MNTPENSRLPDNQSLAERVKELATELCQKDPTLSWESAVFQAQNLVDATQLLQGGSDQSQREKGLMAALGLSDEELETED